MRHGFGSVALRPCATAMPIVDRVARLAEQLPMSASEIARQALGIGLDEIERLVGETSSGLGAAAKLGARARGAGRKR